MFATHPTFHVPTSNPPTFEEKKFCELALSQDALGNPRSSEQRAPQSGEHLVGAHVLEQLARESFREPIGRPNERAQSRDALAAEAGPVFFELQQLARTLVLRGALRRGDLPRRQRDETLDQRCERVIRLVELIEENDDEGFVPSDVLVKADRLAHRLYRVLARQSRQRAAA